MLGGKRSGKCWEGDGGGKEGQFGVIRNKKSAVAFKDRGGIEQSKLIKNINTV